MVGLNVDKLGRNEGFPEGIFDGFREGIIGFVGEKDGLFDLICEPDENGFSDEGLLVGLIVGIFEEELEGSLFVINKLYPMASNATISTPKSA